MPFFVLENHGNSTSPQIDLVVSDNKATQLIVAVHPPKELPLRLGVLIDASNSERRSSLYGPEVQAASELLNETVKTPENKVFIGSFDVTADVSAFMNRDELLKFKIELTPGSGTALQDAIHVACKERMQRDPTQPARRVLVVLSDGDDNMSHVTREEAIAMAQKTGTVIFIVGTSEGLNGNVVSRRLEQLADNTGGQAFFPFNNKDIPKVFTSIKEQIEALYAVTFVPAAPGKPGKYHSIGLKTTSDKKAKLRAPKGYYYATTAAQ